MKRENNAIAIFSECLQSLILTLSLPAFAFIVKLIWVYRVFVLFECDEDVWHDIFNIMMRGVYGIGVKDRQEAKDG